MNKASSKIFATTLGVLGGFTALRFVVHQLIRQSLEIVMTDPYLENLAELLTATKRTGVQNILETSFRAEQREIIKRPLGTPRKFLDFTGLMFISAHLDRVPLPSTVPIDTRVVIGPMAQKPLSVRIPLLVSGMAYQRALSAAMKYAFAVGSSQAGTATNTGEGPYLPKERELAAKLIVQYPRTPFDRDLAMLATADAIEIQIGQGASGGGAQAPYPQKTQTALPALKHPRELPRLVQFLKDAGRGVPVGVKFSFTDNLEREIDLCLEAGVDYLALEGAQAATVASPPILEDDFGLPTLMGLCRAVDHLKARQMHRKVSLIVSGGFINPGQCLKALALGADAIYLGTAALFAASHTQSLKAIPWEPPTQVAVFDGKLNKRFNWKKGATHLGNFLISSTEELKEGVRALGKRALQDVDHRDLIALDETTSSITGIPLAYAKKKVWAGPLGDEK